MAHPKLQRLTGGSMEFCRVALVYSAPTHLIQFHPYHAYAPFQRQDSRNFARSRTDWGTSLSYKPTTPLDYGNVSGERVHQQCQTVIANHTKI